MDVEWFPFDMQRCQMKFGSWTFNAEQVNLAWYDSTKNVDLNDYVPSGTWDVVDVPGSLATDKSVITFNLIIKRKTLFYTVNLITPTVLISFLSILTFYLPSDSCEKMTLSISILLALVMFLLLLSKILPPTSIVIPLVAKYLLFAFIMNIVTILVTVIIINWNYRGPTTHRMPRWVKFIFIRILPRVLRMRRPKSWQPKLKQENKQEMSKDHTHQYTNSHNHQSPDTNNDVWKLVTPVYMDTNIPNNVPHVPFNSVGDQDRYPDPAARVVYELQDDDDDMNQILLSPEINRCAGAVQFIAEHFADENEDRKEEEDWKYVAMVIDRLVLYIFFGVTVGGTFLIIMNAPELFKVVDQEEIIASITGKVQ